MTDRYRSDPESFADNLLIGAKAISEFMFGTPDKWRRVCDLGKTGRTPIRKLGCEWSALKTELIAYMKIWRK